MSFWRLVLIGRPLLENEEGLAGWLEDLWGEGVLGFFPKMIVDWIKGKRVDVLRLVSWCGRMLAWDDWVGEVK